MLVLNGTAAVWLRSKMDPVIFCLFGLEYSFVMTKRRRKLHNFSRCVQELSFFPGFQYKNNSFHSWGSSLTFSDFFGLFIYSFNFRYSRDFNKMKHVFFCCFKSNVSSFSPLVHIGNIIWEGRDTAWEFIGDDNIVCCRKSGKIMTFGRYKKSISNY